MSLPGKTPAQQLDFDVAVVMTELGEWITAPDLCRTLASRGREWTTPRVSAALIESIHRGRVETARDGRGNITMPQRYRRRIRRPGEIEPSERPGGMT